MALPLIRSRGGNLYAVGDFDYNWLHDRIGTVPSDSVKHVAVGSFGWFTLVAHLTQKGKHVLGDKAAWIPRIIGVALMVYAVYLIARAVKYVVA